MVIFGGFDSYIEEFFPILATSKQKGFSVIAFEGPGQGSVIGAERSYGTRLAPAVLDVSTSMT